MFRRKLLKRPLPRRCPTEYIQPHGLPDIAARYLEGHLDSPQDTLARFLRKQIKPLPALVDQIWAELVGQGEFKASTQVQKAALVILWMAMRGDELRIPAPKPLQKLPDWRVGKSGAWSSQAVPE